MLEGAARILKPGGRIFLGDVQGNALLATHHAMALREHAPAGTTSAELREKAALRLARETELSIDPAWFDLLGRRIPALSHIETLLRRGKLANETTTYHYDVILHADPAPTLRELPQSHRLEEPQHRTTRGNARRQPGRAASHRHPGRPPLRSACLPPRTGCSRRMRRSLP